MSIFAVVLRSLRGKPSKLPLVSINMMTSLGQPMPALYQGLFLTSNVIWSLAARGHWFKIVLHRKALPQSAKIWALWGSFRYDPVPFLTSLGFTKLYNLSVMVLQVPWPFPIQGTNLLNCTIFLFKWSRIQVPSLPGTNLLAIHHDQIQILKFKDHQCLIGWSGLGCDWPLSYILSNQG